MSAPGLSDRHTTVSWRLKHMFPASAAFRTEAARWYPRRRFSVPDVLALALCLGAGLWVCLEAGDRAETDDSAIVLDHLRSYNRLKAPEFATTLAAPRQTSRPILPGRNAE